MTWMLASRLEGNGGWPGRWRVRWLWCWALTGWVVYNSMGLGAVMWRWHTHKSFIATPRPGRPPPASSSSSLKALPRPWPGSGTTVLRFYGSTALQLYGLASTDFRTLIPTSTSLLPISVKPHRQHCCRCFWSTWQAPLPCRSRATATHTQPPILIPIQTCGRSGSRSGSGSVTAGSRPHATFGHGSVTVGNTQPPATKDTLQESLFIFKRIFIK